MPIYLFSHGCLPGFPVETLQKLWYTDNNDPVPADKTGQPGRDGGDFMDHREFYELMLDNIPDGVYILDDVGNYIYANSTYLHDVGISKSELMTYNVHDFLKHGQIDICISDIVYREKRRVVMFQDVAISNSLARPPFRQLVISNPIFGADGQVQNILAICRPLDTINAFFHEASASGVAKSQAFSASRRDGTASIVAESPAMRNILQAADEIADIDTSVLVTGESGTGKEVIAQYIHDQGHRREGRLVVINCAALPENLLEAELFGYEKGAFTGALATGKPGLFEEASGGTLFLDEINSLPLSLQGKLLRAIETKTVQRIGSTKSKKVDFRLISATNEDLLAAVEEKRFRADLYYRLNVIPLELPPLRERKEDIIPLALYFLQNYNQKYNKAKCFTTHTLDCMEAYEWAGNVRELKNFVERSVVMTASDYIDISNIRSVAASHQSHRVRLEPLANSGAEFPWENWIDEELPLQEYMDRCEREYISHALQKYKNSYAAAEKLGTSQSSIMRRKKKYGL